MRLIGMASFLLMFITGLGLAEARAQEATDLSPYFKDTVGAFVLYDQNNNRYLRYNEARCRERFSPKSTFKIPNSLIGLESGVIKDADFVIPWNREKYPPQDFGLKSLSNIGGAITRCARPFVIPLSGTTRSLP